MHVNRTSQYLYSYCRQTWEQRTILSRRITSYLKNYSFCCDTLFSVTFYSSYTVIFNQHGHITNNPITRSLCIFSVIFTFFRVKTFVDIWLHTLCYITTETLFISSLHHSDNKILLLLVFSFCLPSQYFTTFVPAQATSLEVNLCRTVAIHQQNQ